MSRVMSRRPRFDECLDSMHRRAICHNMPANVEELTIPSAIRSSSSLSYLFKSLLTAPRPVAVPLAARHASSNCSWPSLETKKDVCLVSILVLLPASQASFVITVSTWNARRRPSWLNFIPCHVQFARRITKLPSWFGTRHPQSHCHWPRTSGRPSSPDRLAASPYCCIAPGTQVHRRCHT